MRVRSAGPRCKRPLIALDNLLSVKPAACAISYARIPLARRAVSKFTNILVPRPPQLVLALYQRRTMEEIRGVLICTASNRLVFHQDIGRTSVWRNSAFKGGLAFGSLPSNQTISQISPLLLCQD